jgi:hypothetical protein
MTFLERIQAHKGGLLKIKTELYWYGQGRYDGNPGRTCLILDDALAAQSTLADLPAVFAAAATGCPHLVEIVANTAVYLLIDGQPQWIWVDEGDVELL